MTVDQLHLTPLRPVHALTLGALDHSAEDADPADRSMRYAMIRRWVISAYKRPQGKAFLVNHAGAVIGACSLTSVERRPTAIELHLVCPEPTTHREIVAGVLTLLEASTNSEIAS
ncbi:hypothetical protein SFC88_16475 [Nocardioides sp. HM23]|uniref:hypothetical protein n=1 Tax=Nocardioides bizhenqiangii TaxID=3095076 RepID=UPI002ACAB796|nr:hypothetical protein [Nocardioides sp. HM23]MDZ5622441.1 hypothetical protein [Nocardioides sp. HM23]